MNRIKDFIRAHRTAILVCFTLLLMAHLVLWMAVKSRFGFHAAETQTVKYGLFIIECVIAGIAALYGRYQYCKNAPGSTAKIDEDCGVTFKVSRFVSDTSYYYEQPGTPAAVMRAVGVQYDRGKLEKLIVTVTNTTGADIETDDSFFLEKQVGSRWYPVESFEPQEPWQPMTIPVGQSECTFTTWRRYDTLERRNYRILKKLDMNGRSVTVGGSFWLGS